jgi:hypothetical protein
VFVYLDRDIQKRPFVESLGVQKLADTLLWMGGNPTSQQIALLNHAIPNYKGVIWYQQRELNKDITLFNSAELMQTNDETAIRIGVQHLQGDVDSIFRRHLKFTRYGVKWIEEEEMTSLGMTSLGSDRFDTIALIPFDNTSGWQWSSVVYGLEWHREWYYAQPKVTENRWIFLIDEVLHNYLKLTLFIDGIPALPFTDIDANGGWVFFGPYEQLNLIHTELKEAATAYTQEEFEIYYRRLQPSLTHYRSNV